MRWGSGHRPVVAAALSETLEALVAEGWKDVEVYHKRGRSRQLVFETGSSVTSLRREEGWAVRAGDPRRSFFYAQTGEPTADGPWPSADGRALRLPSATGVPTWAAPSDLDSPLVGESEAQALVEAIAMQLQAELPQARLLRAELEDGSSESQLISSQQIEVQVRQRAAVLYLQATSRGGRAVSLLVPQRQARQFHPQSLARRLADRLLIAEKGTAPPRDRGDFLLAPPLMAALLAALQPLWRSPEAIKLAQSWADRQGKLGSGVLTLIDNGRLECGISAAPVDGEGMPTRAVTLIEEGAFRQPLLAWWEARRGKLGHSSGCLRRASWRDLPRPGATHLYLQPDPAVSVAQLLADIRRGYYLLDVEGGPRLDLASGRFAVPVCGFSVESGRPTGAVAGAWLTGTVQSLLHGLLAAARDLTFTPLAGGLVGAPSVLVKGLELRAQI